MTAAGDGPLFITTDAVGGVWSYNLALARGVAASGRCSILAVLGPDASPDKHRAVAGIAGCRLVETGLPLDWTVTSRGALEPVVLALIGRAQAAGCVAAHLHAPALACKPWPIPVVAVAHSCMATWWDAVHGGTPPAGIAWHRDATACGLDAADAIVAPSGTFAAAIHHVYRPGRPVHVVHNGLPERAPPGSDRERAVLAAGRLWDAGKNMAVLDAAAGMLDMPVRAAGPSRGPDGGCAQFSHLRQTGELPQEALRGLMAASAVFAAPSVYEPFGLAVLEAAQQAAALVLSDIPVFRELWADAALFVAPGRPADWAATIRDLADDPDRARALGQAAAVRSRRYTQQAMVAATMQLHRGTVRHARRAA